MGTDQALLPFLNHHSLQTLKHLAHVGHLLKQRPPTGVLMMEVMYSIVLL